MPEVTAEKLLGASRSKACVFFFAGQKWTGIRGKAMRGDYIAKCELSQIDGTSFETARPMTMDVSPSEILEVQNAGTSI